MQQASRFAADPDKILIDIVKKKARFFYYKKPDVAENASNIWFFLQGPIIFGIFFWGTVFALFELKYFDEIFSYVFLIAIFSILVCWSIAVFFATFKSLWVPFQKFFIKNKYMISPFSFFIDTYFSSSTAMEFGGKMQCSTLTVFIGAMMKSLDWKVEEDYKNFLERVEWVKIQKGKFEVDTRVKFIFSKIPQKGKLKVAWF